MLNMIVKAVCGAGRRFVCRGPCHAMRWVCHHVYERYREWILGVDTASFDRWIGSIGHDACHDYEPMSYACIERTLGKLSIRPGRDVFLDYGCGKGRAVIVAATLPFARVIGVELMDDLCDIARANVRKAARSLVCKDVEIVAADATQYEVPDDATVIYFYNPFWDEVLAAVQERIRASLVRNPRKLSIVYLLNPGQHDAFAQLDWLDRVSDEPELWENVRCVIYETSVAASCDVDDQKLEPCMAI